MKAAAASLSLCLVPTGLFITISERKERKREAKRMAAAAAAAAV